MTVRELLDIYTALEVSRKMEEAVRPDRAKVNLRGVVGSAAAILAAAQTRLSERPMLFVLKDREQAVYFLNDLQNMLELPVDGETKAQAVEDTDGIRTRAFFFPRTARVPYQTEDTDNMNVAMRAEVMNELNKGTSRPLIVTHAEALFEKVITISDLKRSTFEIQPGNRLSFEFVDEIFHEFHFEKVDYVYEPGQYAVRGGILDVFSYSHDHPYRVELFGDEVDSIRTFDPVTQLSVNKAIRATVVPDVSKSEALEQRVSLIEFLPKDIVVWASDIEGCMAILNTEYQRAEEKFSKLDGMMKHAAPDELYLDDKTFLRDLQGSRLIEFGTTSRFPEAQVIRFDMTPQPSFNKNFEMLSTNLANNDKNGYLNILAAGQAKQIERLYQIFEDKDHEVHARPLLIELSEGFIDKEHKILCYTDHQIFERFHKFRLKEGFKKGKEALTIKELMALQPGDYVVHIDHGIGQFAGLQKIDVNGKEQEAIRLTYKGGDILYVSIHSLHRISKYVGKDGTAPSVDKLGSNAWQNLKRKTKTRVKELAFDLLKLYAKRRAMKGFSFSPDTYLQTELEASFMYEDTPDQLKATVAVKEDMEAQYPMDRLVCGDVGFGKTEIAMRAAFKAVADSKQVAVLVPTTILSMQHFRSFSARFKDFPCKVDYINRFKSAGKQTETLKALEKGEIDIIIGTHGLVGKKVKFKNLGLLIIDEEQKFGVAVKDKLKTLRENVDTLTLTATPIPRTLQFSLMGARDMSIIQTPPPNRVPIETTLTTFNEEVIRDAVSFEISRGGQVFFVNNRIQNLPDIAGMIQRLCPDVRIGIVHGQMEGDKLEEVMEDFIEGTYDVLVSTAIVESGIDIGNANTIIINDAHQFGLSDLHQLRGRVGRTNKRAFCYLIAPPQHFLTEEARKRLHAITQFSDLGSGLHIAMRDLDIRGAGNLLGGEQSGFINDIGFETYQKILDEAIQELKQEQFKDLYEEELKKSQKFVNDTQLETDFEFLIPDDYVSNISERLALYKELDDIDSEEQLTTFTQHLRDRFGEIPEQALALLDTIQLRWLAREIGFEKLVLKSGKMIGYFVRKKESPYYESEKFTRVLEFIRHNPHEGKMYEKDDSLRISFNHIEQLDRAVNILKAMHEGTRIARIP